MSCAENIVLLCHRLFIHIMACGPLAPFTRATSDETNRHSGQICQNRSFLGPSGRGGSHRSVTPWKTFRGEGTLELASSPASPRGVRGISALGAPRDNSREGGVRARLVEEFRGGHPRPGLEWTSREISNLKHLITFLPPCYPEKMVVSHRCVKRSIEDYFYPPAYG